MINYNRAPQKVSGNIFQKIYLKMSLKHRNEGFSFERGFELKTSSSKHIIHLSYDLDNLNLK